MKVLLFLTFINIIPTFGSDEPPHPNPVLVTPRNFFESSGYLLEDQTRLITLLKFDQKEIVLVRVSSDFNDESVISYKNYKQLVATTDFSSEIIYLKKYHMNNCKNIKTGFKENDGYHNFYITCLKESNDGEETKESVYLPIDHRFPIYDFNS